MRLFVLNLICGMLLVSSSPAWAVNKHVATTSGQLLKLGIGARPIAMGGAYCGVAGDSYAIYWNPGALGWLTKPECSFMYNEYIEEIQYEYLGGVQPLEYVHPLLVGVVGGSVTYLGTEVNGYTEDIAPYHYTVNDTYVTIAYAYKLKDYLSVGGAIKGIFSNIDGNQAEAVGVDIGWLYETTNKGLTLGFSVLNMGSELTYIEEGFPLPATVKLGCAYKTCRDKLLWAFDLNKSIDNETKFNSGIEYKIVKPFAVRMGYNSRVDEGSGITGGFGVNVTRFNFDFAYADYGAFENSWHSSVIIKF